MANHITKHNIIIDNSNLQLVGNILTYTSLGGTIIPIDLSQFLDNTNLSRIISGAVVGTDIVLTRNDATTLTIDISTLGGSTGNPAVNYINSDISTNLNANPSPVFNTFVPIFGTNEEVYSGNTFFTKISDETLLVNFDGFALLGFSIHMEGSAQRTAVQARVQVNGNLVGPVASTGYIRSGGQGHLESSLHTTFIHEFVNGSTINVGARREAANGVVVMSIPGTSNFFIQKL